MLKFTNSRGYLIGAVSSHTGVHIETIRYYERIGVMPKPERTAGGNRLYRAEPSSGCISYSPPNTSTRRWRPFPIGVREGRFGSLAEVDKHVCDVRFDPESGSQTLAI